MLSLGMARTKRKVTDYREEKYDEHFYEID
jgi:hypothetical protein